MSEEVYTPSEKLAAVMSGSMDPKEAGISALADWDSLWAHIFKD